MHHLTIILIATILLTHKLAVCEWTFSLRISSAQCCDSPVCEQVGTCDDFFIALCLRDPGHTVLDRVSCPVFIAGTGRDIIGRQLTPDNIITANLAPAGMTSISTTYRGGFQVYTGVLTRADLPPYGPNGIIIDELFIEVVSGAGGGETSVTMSGERANISLSSISVQCIAGYSGEDCTVNTCSEDTCNQTLAYCNSEGECICREGVSGQQECTPPKMDITDSPQKTPMVDPLPESEDGNDTDLVPIIAGAVVGGLVLLILTTIAVVVIVLLCRRNKKKKSEMYILTGSPTDSTSSSSSPAGIPLYSQVNKEKKRRSPPEIPLYCPPAVPLYCPTPVAPYSPPAAPSYSPPAVLSYSKVNKEKKRRPPPAIPPYQGAMMNTDNDVRVDDVTYATTLHREVLVYADVDHTRDMLPTPRPRGTQSLANFAADGGSVSYSIVKLHSPRPQLQNASDGVYYSQVPND